MNNGCSYGEEQLAGLLYEDGDEAELIEIRAHLAECADCRAELENLTSMKDLLGAWPNVVNAPRMVYVNEHSGFLARFRRWADEIGRLGMKPVLRPAMAAAAVVLVFAVSVAVLDVRVAPDGSVQIGLGSTPPATDETTAAITREEFQEGLTQTVAYLEELLQSRSEEERRLLMTAIDGRLQEEGMAINQQLRNVVAAAFNDMEQQRENDLGLVFSAMDELGVITGMELQRMNTILASLVQSGPGEEE